MKKYDDLAKIAELRDRGILNEEEFQKEKSKLLDDSDNTVSRFVSGLSSKGDLLGMGEDTYCMILHLSQFLIIPLFPLGVAIPIVLWLFGKSKSSMVDYSGRVMFNWFLTALIFFAIGLALCVVFVGYPILLITAVMCIAFPIIAAIKAGEGIVWTYPLCFDFFGAGKVGATPHETGSKSMYSGSSGTRDTSEPKSNAPEVDTHFKQDKYQSGNMGNRY